MLHYIITHCIMYSTVNITIILTLYNIDILIHRTSTIILHHNESYNVEKHEIQQIFNIEKYIPVSEACPQSFPFYHVHYGTERNECLKRFEPLPARMTLDSCKTQARKPQCQPRSSLIWFRNGNDWWTNQRTVRLIGIR